MKKIRKSALPVIFILHLYPVLHVLVALVSSTLETRWRLTYGTYPLAYAIIVFIATLAGAIFRRQIMPEKGFGKACALLLLPAALVNTICASFEAHFVSILLVAFSCVGALLIFLILPIRKWLKILGYAVSGELAIITTMVALFALTFGMIGVITTVVQEVKSPDGQYTAYLTDVDQGALGGDTRIEIMKKPINTPFGRYSSYYYRDWDDWAGVGVLSEITFEWLDNETLIYGNTEIDIGK